jgi:hydroxymethylbilane synthase
VIKIGARNSPLARAQADAIADALKAYGMVTEFVPIRTQGDVDRRELTQIGGTGVFTAAVRDALLDRTVDIAVHSCKDLPTAAVEGLEVIAYPAREDSRDVLVGLRLGDLDSSRPIRIGTGAPRRVVQLEKIAADRGLELRIEPVRGNVDTRLDLVRTGKLDAVVLAAAGLRRLGRMGFAPSTSSGGGAGSSPQVVVAGLPAEVLPYDLVLPAPGQGALAVEIRSETATALDSEIRRVLTRLDDAVTRAEVLAERRFLAVLEAGCTAPVGARAEVGSATVRDPGADLTLVAVIGRTMGKDLIALSGSGSSADPDELGSRLANQALTMIDREEIAR